MEEEKVEDIASESLPCGEDVKPTSNEEDGKDVTVIDEISYTAINRHYDKLLENIENGDSDTGLRAEISNLLQKFRTIYTSQTRLIRKVRELSVQIQMKNKHQSSFQKALNERNTSIKTLEEEIQKLHITCNDIVHQKEEANNSLEAYKQEMDNKLKALQEVPQEKTTSQRNQMMKLREEIIVVRTAFQLEISDLKNQIAEGKSRKNQLQESYKQIKDDLERTRKNFMEAKRELQEEQKRRGKTERELHDLKVDTHEKVSTISLLREKLKESLGRVDELDSCSQKLLKENSKHKTEVETLIQTQDTLRYEFDVRKKKLDSVQSERDKLQEELMAKIVENCSLKADLSQAKRENFVNAKRVSLLEGFKNQAQEKIDILKRQIEELNKVMEASVKDHLTQEREMSEMKKAKDNLVFKLAKSDAAITQLGTQIKVKDEKRIILDQELKDTVSMHDKAKDRLNNVEKEKLRLTSELRNSMITITEQKDAIKILEIRVNENEKQFTSLEMKLAAENCLREECSHELYELRKKYQNSIDTIAKEKSKADVATSYAEQLKETRKNYEAKFREQKGQKEKLEAELVLVRGQVERQHVFTLEAKAEVSMKKEQMKELEKNLEAKNKELESSRKEIVQMNETKRLLSLLLTNKNKALGLLQRKVELLKAALTRAEYEIGQRVDDIKLLKVELSKTSQSKGLLDEKLKRFGQMKHELIAAEKELTQERLRIAAMEAALQNPGNVHRWRVLEGSDPQKHQLIMKNKELQKKLLQKSSKLDHTLGELEQSREISQELQKAMKKMPGIEIMDKMRYHRRQHLEIKEKYDLLQAETNMNQVFLKSYRKQIDAVNMELKQHKKLDYLHQLKARNTKIPH